MNKEQKNHLWIPDEEVRRVDKTLRGGSNQRDVSFSVHGSKLSRSLQTLEQTFDEIASDNSLADLDILVFRVELLESEKIQAKGDLFNSNGMRVRAVKNTHSAIVTSTNSQFQSLKKRVEKYTSNGTLKSHFDFVEDFKP